MLKRTSWIWVWTLLVSGVTEAGEVDVSGLRWRLLQEPEADPEAPLPGPMVRDRTVHLTPVADGLRVEASWTVDVVTPGWFEGSLIGAGVHLESVRWGGRDAVYATSGGRVVVTERLERSDVVTLVAVIEGDPARAALALGLMAAPRGRVTVNSDRPVTLTSADPVLAIDGVHWTGSSDVSVRWAAPPRAASRGTLVLGTAAVGLSISDAEVSGNARVVWTVRSGDLTAVRMRVGGVGSDLRVTGPNIRSWERAGDVVTVQLQEVARARVAVELAWSAPVPAGVEATLAAATVEPLDVFRVERSLQVARDGDQEVIPTAAGWSPVASSQLPAWGEGLVTGTPVGAFVASGAAKAASARLLRLELVEQPPVMVDVAQHTVVLTEHGRTLTRTLFEVRNERASHLRVIAPVGSSFVGARVGGETAFPVTDESDGWLLPLERSVETVEGLLSFTVEVILLGDEPEWSRHEERSLALPRVDAAIAATRTTVYLPPSYASTLEEAEGNRVDSFSDGEGLTYGFGVGDVGAAEADELFNQAVDAWMSNRFDEAQGYLDSLDTMGASSSNQVRLQANLDVVEGRASSDDLTARRVKDQAKARSLGDERKQEEWGRKAEEEEMKGNYAEAELYYKASLEMNKKLDKLEQSGSVEVQTRNSSLEQKLVSLGNSASSSQQSGAKDSLGTYDVVLDGDDLKVKKKAKAASPKTEEKERSSRERDARDAPNDAMPAEPAMIDDRNVEVYFDDFDDFDASDDDGGYDFADLTVSGELVAPQGASIASSDGKKGSTLNRRAYNNVPTLYDPEPAVAEEPMDTPDMAIAMPMAVPMPVTSGRPSTGWSDDDRYEDNDLAGLVGGDAQFAIGDSELALDDTTYSADGFGAVGSGPGGGGSAEGITIGGSMGGVALRGEAAPEPMPDEPMYEMEETASRSFQTVVQSMPGVSRGGRSRGRSMKRAPTGAAPPPPEMDSPTPMSQTLEALPEPKVEAIAVGVVIPVNGEVLRFQQLLLPVDAAPSVVIRAKRPRNP